MTQEIQLSFTSSALEQLKKELNEHTEYQHVRVGVKGGGCSGLTYVLELGKPEEKDIHFFEEGVNFIIDPKHLLYVQGMVVDYQDGLNARGFEFKNPNAKSTCGCGTSFSI